MPQMFVIFYIASEKGKGGGLEVRGEIHQIQNSALDRNFSNEKLY